MTATTDAPAIGDLLREWRQRRRLSQLDLACDANISARHLSFIETGRSNPSREMILQLAEHLEIPLRDRNLLLTAGGYARVYPETPMHDLETAGAWSAVRTILKGLEPYPALAIDRHWKLLDSNRIAKVLLGAGVQDPSHLKPPVNLLRVCLHPTGVAPRIVNLADWSAHLFQRLHRQISQSGDPVLVKLLAELRGLNGGEGARTRRPQNGLEGIAMPFQLAMPDGAILSLFSTTMVFGTPHEVTMSELAIESLFPADEASASILAAL